MERLLYDNEQLIGPISDWVQKEDPPVYKTFLGKTVLVSSANDICSFVSPKPVKRKSKLTVVENKKRRLTLEILKAIGGTQIQAKIKSVVDL